MQIPKANYEREFKWNLLQAVWIKEHLHLIQESNRRTLVEEIIRLFEAQEADLASLETQLIHNDLNDYNILVDFDDGVCPHVSGILDFGDLCVAPRVCEIAISGAYLVLNSTQSDLDLAAFVAGYHHQSPLSDKELALIFPLLLTRLAVSVVNSAMMKQSRPDDDYVVVSETPAWTYLESLTPWAVAETLGRIRVACGLPVTPDAQNILQELDQQRGTFAPVLGKDLADYPRLDLSCNADSFPKDPFAMSDEEAAEFGFSNNSDITLSHYGEPRLLYTDTAFTGEYPNSPRRTIHTGVDIFAPAGTPVYAPMEGEVQWVEHRSDHLDYGGLLILSHRTSTGRNFSTLYGHLDPQVAKEKTVGDKVNAGDQLGNLGEQTVNGGWSPHLHFQLSVLTQDMRPDWLGVAYTDDKTFWCSVYPNPASLLNIPPGVLEYRGPAPDKISKKREHFFADNLKLSYEDPCLFMRGWKQYLFDQEGRVYLDAYNNVPHVGHAHPDIAHAVTSQLTMLNTNTRYLHPAQTRLAELLVDLMPEGLNQCFFVNSASEANELALRMARAHTGCRDTIVCDYGYHGITTGCIDISAYKFDGPGGDGPPDWVHVTSIPDTYGNRKTIADFGQEIDTIIKELKSAKRGLACYLAESFPSVGGQVIPPPAYLSLVYDKVRKAGGICIADEVQTGLGRIGHFWWGFEQQEVVPDMVVLGKPLGNGHPVAAVVTTQDIAESFVTGMEFFSTFGGSTVSCVAAATVLEVMQREKLKENAATVGDYLLEALRSLQQRHRIIGDVRGMGLFLGVELVLDQNTRSPAVKEAQYVKNRLRQKRILIGTDGPFDNVLKIRPPMPFSCVNADCLVAALNDILHETPCRL